MTEASQLPAPPDVDPVDPGYSVPEGTYPSNELPEQPAGDLDFYQRTTLGIKWDPEKLHPASEVDILASSDGTDYIAVRSVPNNGNSSVTYPADFAGKVYIAVVGGGNYCAGSADVK